MRKHFHSGLFLIAVGAACLAESCSPGRSVLPTNRIDETSREPAEGEIISRLLIETSGKWIGPDRFLPMVSSKEGAPFRESVLEEDVERIHKSGYAKEIVATSELINGKVEIHIKIVIMDSV
jgi:hypothetical protein